MYSLSSGNVLVFICEANNHRVIYNTYRKLVYVDPVVIRLLGWMTEIAAKIYTLAFACIVDWP